MARKDVTTPKLLLTLLVRDEIETVKSNLDFHRSLGIDYFIVTDNGSIDGTAEYLRSLAALGEIKLIEEPSYTHNQGAWVTRMAQIAASDFEADWLIHCDADEFFWPERGDLKDFFRSVPADVNVIRVRRVNLLKDPSLNAGHFLLDNVLEDAPSARVLRPKVCHRPDPKVLVAEGNHHVTGIETTSLERPEGLVVLHYPYRSYSRYESKIVNGVKAVESNRALPSNVAVHWRNANSRLQEGELRKDFEKQLPDAARKEAGLGTGRYKMVDAPARYAEEKGVAARAFPVVKPAADRSGFVYMDVGARGGVKLVDVGMPVVRIMVEPEINEFRKLSQNNTSDYILGVALGDADADVILNEAKNPFCSSVLKPNMEFLKQYRIAQHFATTGSVSVSCARFDTIRREHDLPIPGALKIDVQGFEYRVLIGFGEHLQGVLAIKLETHFYPIYEGQKLLQDLIDLLARHDFALRRISNSRSPDLRGDRHFDGDLVEVDAVFTKRRSWLAANPDACERFSMACKLFEVSDYQ